MLLNLIITNSHSYAKQIIEKSEKNIESLIRMDYSAVPLDEILYEFSSISLFDSSKLILVENCDEIFSKGFENQDLKNYFEHPSDISKIYFVANKVDKNNYFYQLIQKNYKVYTQDDGKSKFNNNNNIVLAKKYIIDHGSSISDRALNYIKDATLNNYDLMISEIDKLLILGKTNITDELAYNLVILTPDGNTNRFIDALLNSDGKEALKLNDNFKTLNIDLTKMIALISWNVRVTYLIKKYRKDSLMINKVIKDYKISDYSYNNFVRKGNIRSLEELENLIIELSNLDLKIKEYQVTKENIGDYLINMFCV